jgi:protein TonB
MAQEPSAPTDAQAAPVVPAPKAPAAKSEKKPAPSPRSLTAWRGKVIAHLNSAKREFGTTDGVSTVAFSIDRSGKVLTAKVLASSGNKTLDQEAVALTQRASPVPAPPADISGETIYLKVPIRFKR